MPVAILVNIYSITIVLQLVPVIIMRTVLIMYVLAVLPYVPHAIPINASPVNLEISSTQELATPHVQRQLLILIIFTAGTVSELTAYYAVLLVCVLFVRVDFFFSLKAIA